MKKGDFDTSLQQLSEQATPVAHEQERAECMPKRRLCAAQWYLRTETAVSTSTSYARCYCPEVRHLLPECRTISISPMAYCPLYAEGGHVSSASSVAMCESLLIQVVGFCGLGLRLTTRRALPAERSIWPGSATATSTPKPITFRI
jgi:hypothetical protein